MANIFAEFGTGERGYTKALRHLIDHPHTQAAILDVLERMTGLRLSGQPVQVLREQPLPDGSTPDVQVQSQSVFVLLEAKLDAALTEHQRRHYLSHVDADYRAARGLVFVVPEAQLARYEGEVAGLVQCRTVVQANNKLKRKGISLHVVTWSDIAQRMTAAIPFMSPVGVDTARQFVDYLGMGKAGETGEDERPAVPVDDQQAAWLASPFTGRLLALADEVTQIALEAAHALRIRFNLSVDDYVGGFSVNLRNTEWCVEIGPNANLAAKHGRSLVWATVETGEVDFQAEALAAKIRQSGLHAIVDKHDHNPEEEVDVWYEVGVPLPIPSTPDLHRESNNFKATLTFLFESLGGKAPGKGKGGARRRR